MNGRLEGKVAIVTGAASGIGRASAIRFAAEGAAVGCTDIESNGLEETVSTIRGAGGEAIAIITDIADESQVEGMVSEVRDAYGPVKVLYANAGIAGAGTAADISMEQWSRVISINLTGVWLSSRYCLPQMIDSGGGSIINQSSLGALMGVPGIASYAAAKGGVIGLTKQMAVEYGPMNIRVNAICPGTVPTPLVERTYAERAGFSLDSGNPDETSYEELLEVATERVPLARMGTVDEIAALALYLASDESAWTNGAVIPIDGGMLVK